MFFHLFVGNIYFAVSEVVKCSDHLDDGICLSFRSHISKTTCSDFTKFLYMLPVAVTFTSYDGNASGFVGDVMFSHNGASGTKPTSVLLSSPDGGTVDVS